MNGLCGHHIKQLNIRAIISQRTSNRKKKQKLISKLWSDETDPPTRCTTDVRRCVDGLI